MRLCLLIPLLALVAAASADTGPLLMTCPEGWVLFHAHYEASCLKIMPEPKLFDDAFQICHEAKSRMLSFSHRMDKVFFINNLIIEHVNRDATETTLWFFDPAFMHHGMATKGPEEPKPEQWMVISPNKDQAKIELLANSTAVPRNFICEAPAHPAAQRPQFRMEPEHLFIADSLVKQSETPANTDGKQEPMDKKRPFIVTYNCEAYGMPKPTLEWRLVHKAENESLLSEVIDAKIIHDPKEPLNNPSMTATTFFNLQRDCKHRKCAPDTIQERSQLIVVNPQFMDLQKNIVCLAKNEFGSVFSREAKFFVTKMDEFANKDEKVSVKSGISTVISNTITTEPDAASAECYRINKPAEGPAQLIPLEQLNHMLHGAIQMSKAKFDLVIDSVSPADAGDFLCRARMHNGRLGHVIREKTINLKVEPCVKADGCDLEAKPVTVVEGYPAVLSMNPLSNRIIRSGDDFLLECPCAGKRRPDEMLTVEWNLRNRTDMPAKVIPVEPRGSALLLQNAQQKTHSGMYYCQCLRGEEKSEWRSINIDVLPSTEPIDHQQILTTKVGKKATFNCRVENEMTGLGIFVEPVRGTETLADFLARTGDKRMEIMRSGPSHFVVTFNEVQEADAGIYGCRVTVNYFDKWIEHDTYYTTMVVEK